MGRKTYRNIRTGAVREFDERVAASWPDWKPTDEEPVCVACSGKRSADDSDFVGYSIPSKMEKLEEPAKEPHEPKKKTRTKKED